MKSQNLVYDRLQKPADIPEDLYIMPYNRIPVSGQEIDYETSRYYSKLRPWYTPEDKFDDTLVFESRFESGNLSMAFQTDKYEYNLYLDHDTSTTKHTQWFYFSIANTRSKHTYKFNINNCAKKNSSFQSGMRPLMYSMKKNTGWTRTGTNIFYFVNGLNKEDKAGNLSTLTFEAEF